MQITKGVIRTAQKLCVYGPEGIGKSTFAANFPDPLFIDTEGSTKHMDVARTPAPTSWAMLLEQVNYVKTHPSLCKTLVIDTADWAEKLCCKAVCSRANKAGIEDFGYGKGFTYLSEEFGRLLNALEDVITAGIHVVFTAHSMMRKFEQPDEMGAYDRWELKLTKQIAPMLREWCDMVLFVNYETFVVKTDDKKAKAQGGKRVAYAAHHPCWDAKNRHGLADKIPFDYSEIAHCFEDRAAASVAVPLAEAAPASSDTVNPTVAVPLAGDSCAEEVPVADSLAGFHSADDEPVPFESHTSPVAGSLAGELPGWEGIPQALKDLMKANGVIPEEIEHVVSKKGYYPKDTPVGKYDIDFINGVLIGAWDAVLEMIQDTSLPY